MNKVYLFGKVVYKSKLKYIISPKLKVYIELVIETPSGDKFNFIANEEQCNNLVKISMNQTIFIIGNIEWNNENTSVNIEEYEII